MPYSLDQRFAFGKHKGRLLSTVIRDDPTYIEWCLLNIDGFELDERASEEYERESDYYYWEAD